jgi:hypothetical protein
MPCNDPEKELVFKRKIRTDSRGQARLTIPQPVADALGGVVSMIWKGDGVLIVCPWPEGYTSA